MPYPRWWKRRHELSAPAAPADVEAVDIVAAFLASGRANEREVMRRLGFHQQTFDTGIGRFTAYIRTKKFRRAEAD